MEILISFGASIVIVSEAWHTCMAKLMGVRPLSRVELMLWVRGVTIYVSVNWYT